MTDTIDTIAEQIANLNGGQYFEIYFPTCKARVSAFVTNGSDNKSLVIGFSDGSGFLSSSEDSAESTVLKLIEMGKDQNNEGNYGEIIVCAIHSY